MAPTLFTSCNALPPGGAGLAWGGPALRPMAPTLFTSCNALPPGGAGLAWGGPALRPMAPTLFTSCNPLPPGEALRLRPGEASSAAPAGEEVLSSRKRKLPSAAARTKRSCGFTLIELLVAISVMALLAVMSWRGLDGMARSQAQTSQRADEVLNLQAGLGQWKVDLDSLTQTPQISSMDWDGRVLRLTRRATSESDGLMVVAWARREETGGQWLRWQSPVFRTVGGWNDAWTRAIVWSQTASAEDRVREVKVSPLNNWQLFYYRGNAWSNPLSSDGVGASGGIGGVPTGAPTAIPDGIRLVLDLPPGQAINGRLTMDWVRPTLGGLQ